MSTGATRIPAVPRTAVPAAAALGLLAAAVVAGSFDATMLLLAAAALAGAATLVLRVEWALPTMAAFSVLRLANVATESHGAPSLFQPLLVVVTFGVTARWLHTRERPSGGSRVALLAGLFVLVAATSFLSAGGSPAAAADFEALCKDAFLAVLAGMLLRSGTDLRRTVWAMVASGALLATLSAFQFATGSFDQSFGGFARSSVENIVDGTDDVRVSGPIGDPNYYAQLLVMLLPLALDRLLSEQERALRWIAGSAAAVMTATILLTFSRGAAPALVLVGALMLAKHPPSRRGVIAVVVAAVVTLPFLPDGYVTRLTTLGQVGTVESTTDVSIRARTSELAAGIDMLRDRPLTGVGYGTFAENYPDYARAAGIDQMLKDREAHNLYLEVGAETGLLGLFAFGSLAVGSFAAVVGARRSLLASGRKQLADTAYAVGVSLAGYYATSVFLHMDFARTYWLLTGMALALPRVAARAAREAPSPREAAWR